MREVTKREFLLYPNKYKPPFVVTVRGVPSFKVVPIDCIEEERKDVPEKYVEPVLKECCGCHLQTEVYKTKTTYHPKTKAPIYHAICKDCYLEQMNQA